MIRCTHEYRECFDGDAVKVKDEKYAIVLLVSWILTNITLSHFEKESRQYGCQGLLIWETSAQSLL